MAESQCVASQWDRSGSIVCSFDSLPTIRFCLTLTRHNCANCLPGFWLWASFEIIFYEYFEEWQKLKMETIHIASAWTNECVSRCDLRLGRCRFWIAHCAKPYNAMQCKAVQCNAQGLNIGCYHQRYLHCLTRVAQFSFWNHLDNISLKMSFCDIRWAFLLL